MPFETTNDPLISVFTPSHSPRWLNLCYESLRTQTYKNWEWVVLLNQGAQWIAPPDRRVRIIHDTTSLKGIGAAKQSAVEECTGSILVELDHDDVLHPAALRWVRDAFAKHPEAGMVYSDYAQIDAVGKPRAVQFDDRFGWTYDTESIDGIDYPHPVAMSPTPHNVSYIWYAPNHLRAFTRIAYDKVGGYDPDLAVLDDQDLMCRLYQYGEFVGINKVLYGQRSHDDNTQGVAHKPQTETNKFIQIDTVRLYDKYIQQNALVWAHRNDLLALDLGAAHSKPEGYLGVDQFDGPGVDYVHSFPAQIGFAESSVGVIRAVDFLEHVEDKVAMMNEIHRLLAPGGLLLSMTPSTDGRGAFQDPTHVAFWNENSFWYFTDRQYANYVPSITAKFQTSRMVTSFPSDWHRDHDISYVTANLIAIKDGTPRNGGFLNW